MQTIFNIINIPLGWVMRYLSNLLGGNFAAAVFVFTLIINLALIPLSIKSQKSSVQQTRIKPKLDELKKRYGDDKQKYSEAMQQLYQDEGVSMSGGCLPMILRLVLMMSIYWLILSPLTYMAGADNAKVNNVSTAISQGMEELEKSNKNKYDTISAEINWKKSERAQNNQLKIIKIIREKPEVVEEILSDKAYKKIEADFKDITEKDKKANINFSFFGIDLTAKPTFSFDIFHKANKLWIMPIIAFLAQMLTSALSLVSQKKINPDAPNMAGMMLTMPLMTLFIGFTLPGGVAFYWACSSLIGGIIQVAVQQLYGPQKMLALARIKELNKECELESAQKKKIEESKLNGESADING